MQLLGFRELIANVQDGVVSCRGSGSGENAVVPQLREKPPVRSQPQQQDISSGIERGKHSVERGNSGRQGPNPPHNRVVAQAGISHDESGLSGSGSAGVIECRHWMEAGAGRQR